MTSFRRIVAAGAVAVLVAAPVGAVAVFSPSQAALPTGPSVTIAPADAAGRSGLNVLEPVEATGPTAGVARAEGNAEKTVREWNFTANRRPKPSPGG